MTDEMPKNGETWHVLMPSAYRCVTLKILDITEKTVLLESSIPGHEPNRYPLDVGLRFIERAQETKP